MLLHAFFLRFLWQAGVNLIQANTLAEKIFLMRGRACWNEQDFPDHARIVADLRVILRSRSDRRRSSHHF
jgi:hypothetical protein